ncbi:MAG: MFS transporter, partial [Thermoguttaceae bacterium]
MTTPPEKPDLNVPWYKTMGRYHWFVLFVCSLGWGFDTFDQQLFAIVRTPALADLKGVDATDPVVTNLASLATSLMLIGWATGGIFFGVMGDKIGRAKTMIFTILVYAVFTGMSGLATSAFDFLLYRFLTGLGVGGQFAAGVTLLSETMPDKARPKTLGFLQIVGALGNMCAGSLQMLFAVLKDAGYLGDFVVWRLLFMVGFLPALLAIVVFRHLEEPQKWRDAIAAGGVKKAGSISDLFTDPRWRYNTIVGMLLATCGVIGLWGIGFFSIDLTRTAFRNKAYNIARLDGDNEKDAQLVRMLVANPTELLPIVDKNKIKATSLIGSSIKVNAPAAIFAETTSFFNKNGSNNASDKSKQESNGKNNELISSETAGSWGIPLLKNMLEESKKVGRISAETLSECDKLLALDADANTKEKVSADTTKFTELAESISKRNSAIQKNVGWWAGIASLLFNFGAVIGTYVFTYGAERIGRRPTFTIAFAASLI